MDLSERYSIAYKGLSNGLHDFDFKVDAALFEEFGGSDIRGGDCDVHVALKRSETMLEAGVTIDGSVVVECDRCLEEFNLPVHFEGQLVVKFSDEVSEYDGEVLWMSPSEQTLDLTQYIYESIVLSLPYQRVHPEGECNPDMLKRFNVVSGAEFATIEERAEAAAEEREAQSREWAKLEALREQMALEEPDVVQEDTKKTEK